MLKFDYYKGILCDDTDSVRKEVQDVFKSAFGDDLDVDAYSPQGQLIDSITAMLVDRDSQLLELANQLDPYKNEGIYQEAIGHIYFLERKQARATQVECICYGLENTFLPKSTMVKSTDNLVFYSLNDATIGENGQAIVLFECEEKGAIIVKENTINTIISVISGFDDVINIQAGILGSEEETRAEFEQRRVLGIAKNSQGSVTALKGAIASLENVVDLIILENDTSKSLVKNDVIIEPHSLYISVLGGSEADIAKAIYEKKSVGCGTSANSENSIEISHIDEECGALYKYTIVRPKALDITIKLSINIKDTTSATIEDDIKSRLLANFYGKSEDLIENYQRVRIGENLLATRFYFALLTQGIDELVSLKISSNKIDFYDEISIDASHFPQLLEENIIIEKLG